MVPLKPYFRYRFSPPQTSNYAPAQVHDQIARDWIFMGLMSHALPWGSSHQTGPCHSPCTLWPDTSNRLIDNVVHIDERGIPALGATEDAHYLPFLQA